MSSGSSIRLNRVKRGFWKSQWCAFAASYAPDEVAKASSPGAGLFVVITFAVVVAVPAYVEPLASALDTHYPLIPILVMAIASTFSYVGWRHGLRGKVGTACTLVDTTLSLAAFQLAAVLSSAPASYAYAGVAGLVLLASQARLYGLTLFFGLATCLPLGLIPLMAQADAPLLIISFSCCVLGLWSSNMTRIANRLRSQNVLLRSALQTADEIVEQNREVVLAGLLLDVGDFVHEIRNAQNSLGVNIAYMLDQKPIGDDLDGCLEDLDATNKRLQGIADETLAMLKRRDIKQTGTFRVADALGKLRHQYNDAQLICKTALGDTRVRGLERDLVGSLTQLVRNASQAGATRIELAARLIASDSGVEISVDDDGPGIPKDSWSKVFEPFWTAHSHSAEEGHGLGLYLTCKRIELMGGRISAQASVLGGARFVLVLPVVPPEESAQQ